MSVIDKIKKNKKIKEYSESVEVTDDFISTGCLPLNILYSGKIDGGIP